ncbi:RNA polymerase subunit sigma [Spongiactinospora rosea]|uniref:RNA polymerase subunit sigma n=1 Tax=Spongiactinospora rosea TaxID=2248750 RepID=A0A366LS21_9ACTN|nr:sigma-70 family RNA polymerase sigma factor [Spongiactinospora rosea]RBQ16104.1 RNA polymerase subunit sigma [Spongiactinospora rosea]
MRLHQDPAVFEDFYRRHVDAVMRFVVRRVSDPHLAADLTADIFLAALDAAHGYRPGRGSEIAWLYGVARNVVSAEHRRTAVENRVTGRVAGRRLMDDDDVGRMEDRIDAERGTRRAWEAMRDLPEGERAVLELVVIDQLTVSEAAEALGVKRVTARVRLHRARRALAAVASPPVVYVEGEV